MLSTGQKHNDRDQADQDFQIWKRLDSVRRKLERRLVDCYLKLQSEDEAIRVSGGKTIIEIVASLSPTELNIFLTVQTEEQWEDEALNYLNIVQVLCLLDARFQDWFETPERQRPIMNCLERPETEVRVCALETLQAILCENSKNLRNWERSDGLKAVCTKLLNRHEPEELHFKIIELLVVYLAPEHPTRTHSPPQRGPKSTIETKGIKLSEYLGRDFVTKFMNTIPLVQPMPSDSVASASTNTRINGPPTPTHESPQNAVVSPRRQMFMSETRPAQHSQNQTPNQLKLLRFQAREVSAIKEAAKENLCV
ncbi:hypothetical protein HDU76_004001 [Blyttiomyces sp. JEL0837]|nr:hypothetical protein HDU76_004001 [Blyttiomyces sp. JEL0837]